MSLLNLYRTIIYLRYNPLCKIRKKLILPHRLRILAQNQLLTNLPKNFNPHRISVQINMRHDNNRNERENSSRNKTNFMI